MRYKFCSDPAYVVFITSRSSDELEADADWTRPQIRCDEFRVELNLGARQD